MPVAEACTTWKPFYVHPKSGLLVRAKRVARRRPRFCSGKHQASRLRLAETTRWLAADQLLFRHAGLCFECKMTSWGRDHRPRRHNLNLRREITSSEDDELCGRRAVCVAKRQLPARELRAHGLANLPGA